MNQLRILSIFIILCQSSFALAQNNILIQIREIDSLVEYNHFDLAEKKADSLYVVLDNRKETKELQEQKLHLLLQKGSILVEKEDNFQSLDILIKVASQAEKNKFYRIACIANIRLSLIYEKSENHLLSKKYLDEAERICNEQKFYDLYSTILIRRSLHHRFYTKDIDSARYYSYKAIEYTKKYPNEYDFIEADVMIAVYDKKVDYLKSIASFKNAAAYYLRTNNYNDALVLTQNVSNMYQENNFLKEALLYNDSAKMYYDRVSILHQQHVISSRVEILEELNEIDSAYYYQKILIALSDSVYKRQEASEIIKVTEQFENEKKEATIKTRNQLLILVAVISIIIAIATILLFFQNQKIRKQNKTIHNHLDELQKLLNQKQVLLSELQHRVKNNLQQVISILDMQKESIDFNNIEELVRENQNRIHSMALLHRKLNIAENINSIDFDEYILELSDLVSTSYYDINKNIQIFHQSSLGKTNIETALPLGLIVVELLSNSLKHAFHHQSEGTIKISIDRNNELKKYQLRYSDNGSGFDFKPSSQKGLGLEIIKGLIDQLNGEYNINQGNGFGMTIYF